MNTLAYFAPERPRVLAHRGLALSAGENTIAAFTAAVDAGAAYVETDAHATADGVAVLVHDPQVVVRGEPHTVADLTLARLRDLEPDGGDVPTLAEALERLPEARFNIDVKADDAPDAVARAINGCGAHDRVLVTSFDETRRRRALSALAASSTAEVATAASAAMVTRALIAARSGQRRLLSRVLDGVHAVQVPERHRGIRIVTPRFVRAIHRTGVEVHVWTVNDRADMHRLLDTGVDGLVTDRCDLAAEVLAER
ncbi:glycerophosphodiester phosphodiesterase [Okibacterium endophyticum]